MSVDDKGKVTIDNPQVAETMTAMLRYTPNPGHVGGGGGVYTNNICPNLVAGCGVLKSVSSHQRGHLPRSTGRWWSRSATIGCRLILLPLEQCNFRCTYCFEDFAIGKMGPEVVRGVKRLIDQRSGDLAHLQISWFGGEPIWRDRWSGSVLACEIGFDGRGLTYVSDMTADGWLLDHGAAGRLADLGIRAFQVSLDRPSGMS